MTSLSLYLHIPFCRHRCAYCDFNTYTSLVRDRVDRPQDAPFQWHLEDIVEWTTDLLEYMRENGLHWVDASDEAEKAWTEHVKSMYDGSLISTTKSWFTGYNSNVDGHDRLRYMVYFGGAPKYRETLAQVANEDYRGFIFH